MLFGEDLTTEERQQVADLWGEPDPSWTVE